MVMPTVRCAQRNVIALFGVNGVGKSVIADTLNKSLAGSTRVRASQVLRDVFGVDRQALETMSPEVKMSIKIPALLREFHKAAEHKFILLDMHLIIPIHQKETTIYEDVWSDMFYSYILKAYFIYAEPLSILDRRKADMKKTGRSRNVSITDIVSDQRLNLRKFYELFLDTGLGAVVDSTNRSVDEVVNKILYDL